METSGNPILDTNLECIKKYNPKLASDILNLPCLNSSVELIETDLKEPNLRYNFIPLHSQAGAEIEAKKIFADSKNTPSSMHIVFGIGLGHLFKECCDFSKGKVIVYEPNLDILRVTLELVDFSKELYQNNVFITSDLDFFNKLCEQNYVYKANCTLLALESYKTILYYKEIEDILRRLDLILKGCNVKFNTSKRFEKNASDMLLKNLPYILKTTPWGEFKDIYKGKTALIISAGPSLDANIETIKKNRDNVVIFCVGTAFKALMHNGITPDFVNIIENQECSGQLSGFDLSNINLITDTYTNNTLYQLKVKNNFLFPTVNNIGRYFTELTGILTTPYITKGTVSYAALESAKMAGFTKLILVGQDLAYLNNQCYGSNSAYSGLVFEINPETNKPEYVIKDKKDYFKTFGTRTPETTEEDIDNLVKKDIQTLSDATTFVTGINGNMLPTNNGYATFIEHFASFAYENKDLDLINTSMVGAQINGFKNIPLDKALEGATVIKKVDFMKQFEFDKQRVIAKLKDTSDFFINVLKKCKEAKESIHKYEREIKRSRSVTPESTKHFSRLLKLYDEINLDNKDFLYRSISFNERLEVQFESRESGKEKPERLFAVLKDFFVNVEEKITETLEGLNKARGIISESVDTKSEGSLSIH